MRRALLLIVVLLTGCDAEPVPPPELPKEQQPLVLSTLPFTDVPRQEEIFAAFAKELGLRLGRPVRFSPSTSYAEVIDRLLAGKVDLAFMGGISYLAARKRGGVNAILITIRRDKHQYKGEVIIKKGSPFESLKDLSGRTFAIADVTSTAGYWAPKRLLESHGLDLDNDLKVEVVGTHSEVVNLVAAGRVDAGCVYEGAIGSTLDDPSGVHVLAQTEAIPNDPVVVRAGFSTEEIDALRAAIIATVKAPAAQPFFEKAAVDGFVPAFDSDFDAVAAWLKIDADAVASPKKAAEVPATP